MSLQPITTKPAEDIMKIAGTYSRRIPKYITLTQAINTVAVSPSFTTLVAQWTQGYSDMKIVISGTSIVLGTGTGLQLQIGDFDFGGTSTFFNLPVNSSLTANPMMITPVAGTGGITSIQFPTGQIGNFIQFSWNCTLQTYTSGTLNIDIILS